MSGLDLHFVFQGLRVGLERIEDALDRIASHVELDNPEACVPDYVRKQLDRVQEGAFEIGRQETVLREWADALKIKLDNAGQIETYLTPG